MYTRMYIYMPAKDVYIYTYATRHARARPAATLSDQDRQKRSRMEPQFVPTQIRADARPNPGRSFQELHSQTQFRPFTDSENPSANHTF